jgi:replicative DNA helicase
MGSDFDEAELHIQDSSRFKVKSGFDTLDHILGGGWDIGTLNVIMAETNNGKCTFFDTKITIRDVKLNNKESISINRFFTKVSKGDYNI